MSYARSYLKSMEAPRGPLSKGRSNPAIIGFELRFAASGVFKLAPTIIKPRCGSN
jgi:hypothetical protein